jgi:hypothetical protein
MYNNSIGTVVAAVILSLAVLILYRWELVAAGTGTGAVAVYRLDRWTGAISSCGLRSNPPANLDCDPK